MQTVDLDYIKSLQEIYRDVLNAFWQFNPNGRPDWGVAPQSLYSVLHDKWELGEIREACRQMAEGGALRVEKEFLYYPTPLGQEIIDTLQAAEGRPKVPPFTPPKPA